MQDFNFISSYFYFGAQLQEIALEAVAVLSQFTVRKLSILYRSSTGKITCKPAKPFSSLHAKLFLC